MILCNTLLYSTVLFRTVRRMDSVLGASAERLSCTQQADMICQKEQILQFPAQR